MKYEKFFYDWLSSYIKPRAKDRTLLKYCRSGQLHILPELGSYELNDISVPILQGFVATLSGKGLASGTVSGIISVLKQSLTKAAELGMVTGVPSYAITRPRGRERRIECFTKAEQKRIEAYLSVTDSPRLFGILLCLYTGLRVGELLALRWRDVDLRQGALTVNGTCYDSWQNGKYVKILDTPKTESSGRTIPIPKQLTPRLREIRKNSCCEYVIEGSGPYGAEVRTYQRSFSGLLRKLKIPHRGFHSLRHTFATRALECGMDVKTLSDILGHTNPTVTLKRYAHSLMEHKTQMMNKVGRLLL